MRSINASFKEVSRKNPELGDYVCLIRAVRGQKFSERPIREFFVRLVDKDDYDPNDLRALVRQLHIASNIVVDDHFERKIAPLDVKSLLQVSVCQT